MVLSREHHDLRNSNVFAQAKALVFGKTAEEVPDLDHDLSANTLIRRYRALRSDG